MFDTVECPYCEHGNDMSEGTIDLPSDDLFDHECENCERNFEVFVEFNPSYITIKLYMSIVKSAEKKLENHVKKVGCYLVRSYWIKK